MARLLHSEDSQSAVSLSDLTTRLQRASEAFEKAVDLPEPDSTAGKKAQVEIGTLRPEILSAVDSLQIRDPEDTRIQALVSTLYRIDEKLQTKWAKRALPALKAFTQSPVRPSARPFPTPKGSSWRDVHIHLISPEEAQIEFGKTKEARNFVSLGFADRRNRSQPQPDSLWQTLRVLATLNGVLDRKELDPVGWQKVQKNIQLLRKKLKAIFNIDSDSIPYDRHQKLYQTAFRLTALEQARLDLLDLSNFRRLGSKKLK